jgi:F-type H+-transporting ATPase subunit epsilon
MTNTIHCDIVSAHREIFSGKVAVVYASGVAGELGIFPRHAPLFTQLKPGTVRIQDESGEEQLFVVSGGILEVQPHVVTIMADTVARSDELDRSSAETAKAEAEQELAGSKGQMEVAEAQVKLQKAIAQLRALERIRKQAKR